MNPTLVHWLFWLPGCVAFASLLSQLAAPTGPRRVLARLLAVLGLVVPWLAPPGSVLRAFVALYLLWTCTKVIELTRDPVPRTALFRWLSVIVLHDLRRDGYTRRGVRPELRLGLLAWALGTLAVAIACLFVAVFSAEALAEPGRSLLRLGAGMLLCYLGVDGALGTFEFVYRACGLRPPVLHDHPILALSLAEFWGRRWNRVVGHWLFTAFYRPIALAGHPLLGLLAAFVGSALLHLYFTWASIGFWWSLVMASFFLVQVPLLWLERAVGQARWPSAARRAWTIGWLVITSPLFVAPTLVTLGNGFS